MMLRESISKDRLLREAEIKKKQIMIEAIINNRDKHLIAPKIKEKVF